MTIFMEYRLVIAVISFALALGPGCSTEPGGGEAEGPASQVLDAQSASYLMAAKEALDVGAFRRALALADSAERTAPDRAEIHFMRGRILTELHRPEEAETAFQAALKLDSEFPGAAFNLGNTAYRRQQYREALSHYERERSTAAVYIAMGRTYEGLGVRDSAEYAYRQALNEEPENAEAHARLGRLLQENGLLDEAREHARRAFDLQPENGNYAYLLGQSLLQLGRVEESLPFLESVVASHPWHYGATYSLGQALMRLGREDEARGHLARADSVQALQEQVRERTTLAKQNPGLIRPWIELGDALRKVHRYEEAIEAYQRAVYLDPSNLWLHTNLATLFLQSGDTVQALRRYRAVLERDSSFTDAWLNLGVAHADAGDNAAARKAWDRILAYDPDHEMAKNYLAKLDE